ncbi:MAG: SH3 domain-containing protein [Croceibacterium sp.]
MRFASALIAAFALCVVTSPAVAESGAVIRADELKAMPFIDAATSARLPANQPVTIVSRKGGWIEVEANGQTGWVRILNVRLAAGSSPAPGQANVPAASLLRTNSSGKTVTTGIKGLGEEDLQNAAPNPAQVAKLAEFAVPASEASANAQASGLVEQQVDFVDDKGKTVAKPKAKKK